MKKIHLRFTNNNRTVAVTPGLTLLEAARAANLEIAADCAGRGTCGKCRVAVTGVIAPLTESESNHLSAADLSSGVRLACQCRAEGDATITFQCEVISTSISDSPLLYARADDLQLCPTLKTIPVEMTPPGGDDRRSDLRRLLDSLPGDAAALPMQTIRKLPEIIRERDFRVCVTLDSGRVTDVVPVTRSPRVYGVAIDVGTTTICASLVDLENGHELASIITANPQRLYGADVASRINLISSNRNGLETLRRLIVNRAQKALAHLASKSGVNPREIRRIVMVGNPTMTHVFLGITPAAIAAAPYVPPTTSPLDFAAADAGLDIAPGARLIVLPASSAYVGADALAAGVRVGMHRRGAPRLLIDLGTNAEILLSCNDGLYACAAAAGPAFEGARIKFGMTARPGAIDNVEITNDVSFTTISGAPPIGLCGTGLLVAIAQLLKAGIISQSGRLGADLPGECPDALRRRVRIEDGVTEFILATDASGREIVLTQKDVREVQLAKGAIRAGVEFLMEYAGISGDDLETIYLAGALGTNLKHESVLEIGLLPGVAPERVSFVGNAALLGATDALLSSISLDNTVAFAEEIEYIELSAIPTFMDGFVEFMSFLIVSRQD